MPLTSLPVECISNILFFLDNKSDIHKCLFVNRYLCRLSVPMVWRNPFTRNNSKATIINTLLTCLNEDEISSLIPCALNFNNIGTSPLFEYGKFIMKIEHSSLVYKITIWSCSSNDYLSQNCIVRKLTDSMYHMIMRQGSNLQVFDLNHFDFDADLPKFFIFTIHEPGITNLRALEVDVNLEHDNVNTVEFLTEVSKFCNSIVYYRIVFHHSFVDPYLSIIKFQPLEKLEIVHNRVPSAKECVDKIVHALEFRSDTLRELSITNLDFKGADLSFISKFERLEQLSFCFCENFACGPLVRKGLKIRSI